MEPASRVLVVGSVNLDTVLHCDHLPGPGETVLAEAMSSGFGGKGANQAVAAARLGARVTLVAAVGDDDAGAAALADLTTEGVDTGGVVVVPGEPTGRALWRTISEKDLVVLDGVFNAIDDADGFARQCAQGVEFGFDGKTLIHPSQVGPANAAFSPEADEVAWARKVADAFAEPENSVKGVLRVEGRMVERLHLAEAHRLIAVADAIAAHEARDG